MATSQTNQPLHLGLSDLSFELHHQLPSTPLSPRPISSRRTSAASSANHSSRPSTNSPHHKAASPSRSLDARSKSRSDLTLKASSQSGQSNPATPSRPSTHTPASVPASPTSVDFFTSTNPDTPSAHSVAGHSLSSTDVDVETASEGPASIWNRRLFGAGHQRQSSSLDSRIEFFNALSTSLSPAEGSLPRKRSLSPPPSEAQEELQDVSSDHISPAPRSESPVKTTERFNIDSDALDQAPPEIIPARQDSEDASAMKVIDGNGTLTPSSKAATVETAHDVWSANFWVVVTDPKTGHSFFYNPTTGDCRWVVPVGTIVLPANPSGDWMEFYDESVELPYYYHTSTRQTRWEKPEGLIIPLTALQALSEGKQSHVLTSRAHSPKQARRTASDRGSEQAQKVHQGSAFRSTYSNNKKQPSRNRHLSSLNMGNQNGHTSEDAVDSPYTTLRTRQTHKSRQPATVGRSRLMSDALEEARKASTASGTRSRIVRQRSAFELSTRQREQAKDHKTRIRAATASDKASPTLHHVNGRRPKTGPSANPPIPRDDSGIVLLPESPTALHTSNAPSTGLVRSVQQGAVRHLDSDSDHRTPFTSTLNSIREQSSSSSSNSFGNREAHGPVDAAAQQGQVRYAGNVASAGSLLTIPAPPAPASSKETGTAGSKGKTSKFSLGKPPLSPARSIDMMTLSSYGNPGPIRRPRDPEKRKSKAASPELRFAPTSPDMKSTIKSRASSSPKMSSSQGHLPTTHRPSQRYFDLIATTKLAPRRKGLFQKKVDSRELLNWRHNDLSPLTTLSKELRNDAMCCAKTILRLCGEREESVFYPRAPAVAIGYTPGEDKRDAGRLTSSAGVSTIAPHHKASRPKTRCILDSQTTTQGDGSTPLEEQRWVLEACIAKPQLRDEVFCQLMTRLQSSAPPSSRFRAWQFLGVLLTTVTPVDDTINKFISVAAEEVGESEVEHESLRLLAQHCLKRVSIMQHVGFRTKAPSVAEIQAAWEAAFHPAVFGQKLEVMMQAQAHAYPDTAIPLVLPFLVQTLFALEGRSIRGVFRLPGDVEKLVELRLRIDRGQYSLKGVIKEGTGSTTASRQSDALTVAGLLRLFLRELEDPLLPNRIYNESLQAASENDVNKCVELVSSLPTIHRRVLLYVVAVLQHFARPAVVRATTVDDGELSQIFAPAIFRCPSTEISIISTNARFEARFVQLLINHLPCDTVDLDFAPNVEMGLEGQNVRV